MLSFQERERNHPEFASYEDYKESKTYHVGPVPWGPYANQQWVQSLPNFLIIISNIKNQKSFKYNISNNPRLVCTL